MRRKKSEKKIYDDIALECVRRLFELADLRALDGDLARADRYVEIARSIGMKHNVRVPSELGRRYCKYCYRYLLPSKTSEVRLNSRENRVEVVCLTCGRVMYYPYTRKSGGRRDEDGG